MKIKIKKGVEKAPWNFPPVSSVSSQKGVELILERENCWGHTIELICVSDGKSRRHLIHVIPFGDAAHMGRVSGHIEMCSGGPHKIEGAYRDGRVLEVEK